MLCVGATTELAPGCNGSPAGTKMMTDWQPYRSLLGDACVDYLLQALGEATTLLASWPASGTNARKRPSCCARRNATATRPASGASATSSMDCSVNIASTSASTISARCRKSGRRTGRRRATRRCASARGFATNFRREAGAPAERRDALGGQDIADPPDRLDVQALVRAGDLRAEFADITSRERLVEM